MTKHLIRVLDFSIILGMSRPPGVEPGISYDTLPIRHHVHVSAAPLLGGAFKEQDGILSLNSKTL